MSETDHLNFEWDEEKYRSNLLKHRVSFEEAMTVFFDENARLSISSEHGGLEHRFVLIGLSNKSRLIVVVHTSRDNDRTIRVISARKANSSERFQYRGSIK